MLQLDEQRALVGQDRAHSISHRDAHSQDGRAGTGGRWQENRRRAKLPTAVRERQLGMGADVLIETARVSILFLYFLHVVPAPRTVVLRKPECGGLLVNRRNGRVLHTQILRSGSSYHSRSTGRMRPEFIPRALLAIRRVLAYGPS